MQQVNDYFRQARERLPSRLTRGQPLSRQEVAELVNQWIFGTYHKVVELDANYVGQLERGLIRWPQRMYREAFRAVLRVDNDAQLGFSGRRQRSATVDPVNRQQFVRLAGSVMTLPWLECSHPSSRRRYPRRSAELTWRRCGWRRRPS